ncbi:substrate-binding domain-containing protein [Herbaspirillum lusitanum]|uniref:Substrate-binding domain-containing protein n=1 Tax=Herbaspirillum lusitanum TaxID=213312 RepID=A0ABW9AFQ8_9BURK
MKKNTIAALALLITGWTAAAHCSADELKVLTAGAITGIVKQVAAEFEQRSGVHVVVDNATAGVLNKRIRDKEKFDVVILTADMLARLAQDGYVVPSSQHTIASVGVGVAVKEGHAVPAIATVEQFKKTLLNAKSIAYIDPASGGSSGIYLKQLFEQMGIAEQIGKKTVPVPGGLVATRLLDGQADLALHQISEILQVKGAHLVGPLPKQIQNLTVYAVGVGAASTQQPQGHAFATLFAGEKVKAALEEHGMVAAD